MRAKYCRIWLLVACGTVGKLVEFHVAAQYAIKPASKIKL
jgi:hypothetical protein